MKYNRYFTTSLFVFHFFIYSVAQTGNFGKLTYAKAINLAGRQRMLSQRMSKAYICKVAGYNEFSAQKELTSSIQIFEEQLKILATNTKEKNVLNALMNVSQFWKGYLNLLTTTPNKATAILIMNKNTNLLELCDSVVSQIEDQYQEINTISEKDYRLIRIINYSGKQRMLSQRLCLYYLGAKLFSKQKNDYKLILRRTFTTFDENFIKLMTSPYNTKEVQKSMSSVLYYWETIKNDESSLYKGNMNIDHIFRTTNSLTESFNIITGLYEVQTSAR